MFLNFGKHTLYYLRCVLIKITVNLLDFILNKILHELHVSPASRIFWNLLYMRTHGVSSGTKFYMMIRNS